MAALVQTYQQQTGTVTMLQGRPTPTTGMMPGSQPNGNHQYMAAPQAPRASYHGVNAGIGYRGNTVPVQQYAFTNTPNLNQGLSQGMQWPQFGAYRTNSSPAIPTAQNFDQNLLQRAHRPNQSVTNMAMMPVYGVAQGISRDDSALPQPRAVSSSSRSQSSHASSGSQSSLSLGGLVKNTPDRYRRPNNSIQHNRSQSSTLPTNMAHVKANQVYHTPHSSRSVPNLAAAYASAPGASVDDSHLYRRPSPEDPKKMRRRSVHTIEPSESFRPILKSGDGARTEQGVHSKNSGKTEKPAEITSSRAPVHSRQGSSESVSSSRSSHSRSTSFTNRNTSVSTANPSLTATDETSAKSDQLKVANVPSRVSSSDGSKRTMSPSPLSKAATMANDSATDSAPLAASAEPPAGSPSKNLDSPAAKQLAAINQKGGKSKNKTSRLRRAFSFGSAAEFRKADVAEEEIVEKPEPSKLHKNPSPAEAYDVEQARIAEAQEAAGLGSSIYGGQFLGSTDNVSISSTASSASIMIRKMGRGMKKSTRSLVGLFRPKSVVGVPAAEPATPEASQAAVSMITAEAQRVNVTVDPAKGGTGFPRLERNSIDAARIPEVAPERLGSSGTDNSASRKSVVGGDKERAEVLAAVRKGILKQSSSPSIRAAESPDLVLPSVPAIADSPNSSAPSTPNDEAHGHRRTGSIAIGNEDYFMSALRLRQDSKSRPGTPQGGSKRNATFSPRIIFYDTWPSQEYDRRGEIATCNRLTPMLAQQIKEELNTFKMEMEVHENSKIYTHFF